jgi:hypothetical protein
MTMAVTSTGTPTKHPGEFQDPVAFRGTYFLRESDVLESQLFLPDLPFGKGKARGTRDLGEA